MASQVYLIPLHSDTFKDPCDYIVSTQMIQNNIFSLKSDN